MLKLKRILLPLLILAVAALIISGCGHSADSDPGPDVTLAVATRATQNSTSVPQPTVTATATIIPTTVTVAPAATPALAVYCTSQLPDAWRQSLQQALSQQPVVCEDDPAVARIRIELKPLSLAGKHIVARRFYAVVAPFATVRDDISLAELQARWLGDGGPLLVAEDAAGPLSVIFGAAPVNTVSAAELAQALYAKDNAMGILPFDQLDPAYKVLTVNGKNLLDKRVTPADYALAVAVTLSGSDADSAFPLLQDVIHPDTNRDVTRMTTLIMTGVTAMSRGTAAKMEQKGVLYPALIISDTLSAADITHVSIEAPFIDGCQVNNSYMNLILCSDYPYLEALRAIGVDIVGLSGNHVNDFGREGARESLQFYEDQGIPVYGSGLNEEDSCKPLIWQSNGNSYAFLAALAWWPEEAWATSTEPGACSYYNNRAKIMDMIHQLSQQVDVVSVELQFEETYNPWPTRDQVQEFRALHDAGADIVTGVQSHVPQAVEPFGAHQRGGPAVILYGLGNLFFDQMQSWDTRTALVPRHTIYDGHLVSTELLTTVLEDFAQPRWATFEERAEILRTIFGATPPRGRLPDVPTPTPYPSSPSPAPSPTATPGSPLPASQSVPATPLPSPTPVTSSVAVRVPSAVNPHPQPTPPPAGVAVFPWPAHQDASQSHFFQARPTPLESNRMEDLGYAFGSTAGGRYRVHHGIDIANPSGTPLLAPADSVVVYAGPDDGAHQYGPYPDFYGNVILFQLDQSWLGHTVYVLYGHLQTVQVASGARVTTGQQVGLTGMTGIAIGPHVHVEVRLDTPDDYNSVYNDSLWMQPFAGYGVIAGQVLTPDGRAWHDVRLQVYRWTGGDSRLYRVFSTYALDDGLRPDPELGENALLGSVPAGEYEIVLKIDGAAYHQRVSVVSGQVAWFSFVAP